MTAALPIRLLLRMAAVLNQPHEVDGINGGHPREDQRRRNAQANHGKQSEDWSNTFFHHVPPVNAERRLATGGLNSANARGGVIAGKGAASRRMLHGPDDTADRMVGATGIEPVTPTMST